MKYQVNEVKEKLYSGVISDVLDQHGYRFQSLPNDLMPLMEDTVLFGPAFTSIGTQVYSMPEDPLTAQCKVVDQLQSGQIYVLVTRGEYCCAVFGELFATAVQKRGGEGVLLDGYARDLKALKKMKFPLFYKGRDPRTSKGRCEINECQVPVTLGGVTIHPDDYIFGDLDGVVVIPNDSVDEILEDSFLTVEKENSVREKLQDGVSLREVYSAVGAI